MRRLLLITPYYNKSNEEGIYRHFSYVLDRVDVPCLLYNVPSRTGCTLSEANVARLSKHSIVEESFPLFSMWRDTRTSEVPRQDAQWVLILYRR